MNFIEIAGRKIGPGHPTYVIAEMSANHMQDFDVAVRIVEAAKAAGADAIKLQTYTPDTITLNCHSDLFLQSGTIWEGQHLYDLYQTAYTPWEWQPKLKAIAEDLGLHCFSSPFDLTAVDFLNEMDVPVFKIASFENVDVQLIKYVAQTGKPIIMSTGMATLAEIDEAVTAARAAGCEQLALLKCTSSYPAIPEEMNLSTIPHLAKTFNVPSGLSDHTMGATIPVAAVALGACIVEKHFTLSREMPTADRAFSMEPAEFKAMVTAIRTTEKALGEIKYQRTDKEKATIKFRRSLFVSKDIKAGEVFTAENVRSVRPAHGLHTRNYEAVIGRKCLADVAAGTPLSWELIAS